MIYIEALAREADPTNDGLGIELTSEAAVRAFAALLLKRAAEVCRCRKWIEPCDDTDGAYNEGIDVCADALLAEAAAVREGSKG